MQYKLNGCNYTYLNDIRENAEVRLSFDKLAQKTFGLSFENWYQSGYWQKDYIPHVLMDGDKVVANVSVNIILLNYHGTIKRYIQIGTVMTDENYRNKGLCGFLFQKIFKEWQDKCDAIYLFANDTVLNFYPKFGFEIVEEYQCSFLFNGEDQIAVKLNMDDPKNIDILINAYRKGNPFSKLSMIDNEGLLMFYCSKFLKECVYYCIDLNAVIIAEFNKENMVCFDIFGGHGNSLRDILTSVAKKETKKITFGFSPISIEKMDSKLLNEEDTTLFMLRSSEYILREQKLMFPLLSHA